MELNTAEQTFIDLLKELKVVSIRVMDGEQIQTAEGLANRGIIQKVSTSVNSFYFAEIIRPCPGILAVLPPNSFKTPFHT